MNKPRHTQDQNLEFSLVLGGPLYQLLMWTRLVKPPLELCRRRMILICAFAWLPLLLLSMIGGVAFRGVNLPFIFDVDTHARFLGSLSLLIFAEVIVHKHIQIIVAEFKAREIIALNDKSKFREIIASTIRLRSSVIIELLIIIFAVSVGHWVWSEYAAINVDAWYAMMKNGRPQLTLAGYWYGFVSLPLFQIILIRWYFRLFIWYRLLWKISRLPLRLNSLHPDKAGGLGFLSLSVFAFEPVLLAHTILLSGLIANRILYTGASLVDFKVEIVGILIYLLLLTFTPLTFFILQLLQSKRIGSLEYGKVASRYVDNFRRKWIENGMMTGNDMLGSSDIQSLSDLSNSFEVEQGMRAVPFSGGTFMQILFITSLPLFPLIFTVIPMEDMITSLFRILL